MALVILTSCATAFEAELMKGHLSDLGVDCVIQGGNFNTVYGPMSATGVNVLVNEEDYARAMQVVPQQKTEKKQPRKRWSWKFTVIYGISMFAAYVAGLFFLDCCLGRDLRPYSEYLLQGAAFGLTMGILGYISTRCPSR